MLNDIQTGLPTPFFTAFFQPIEKSEGAINTVLAGTDDVVINNEEPFLLDGVDFVNHVINIAHPVLTTIE